MRIAIFHNDIPPYRRPLFSKLKYDYDVDIYLASKNENFRKWDRSLENNEFYIFKKFLGCYFSLQILRNIWNTSYTHVVLVDGLPFLFFNIVFVLLYGKKVKVILWSGFNQSAFNTVRFRYLGVKFFHKIFQARIYSVYAYSNETKVYFESLLYKRVEESSQHIDYQLSNLVDSCRTDGNVKDLGFIGYMRKRPDKGLDLLIEFAKLNPYYSLKVIGDGPLLNYYKRIAGTSSNISFLGYLGDKEKFEALKDIDLLLVPSKTYEPWGWVLPEFLASGINVGASVYVGSTQIYGKDVNRFTFSPDIVSLTNFIKGYKKIDSNDIHSYLKGKGLNSSLLSFSKCL